MSAVTVYTLKQCSTCKDAVKWLRAHNVAFTEKPIRETPPTLPELSAQLAAQDGKLGKLFNSSGIEYRALNMAEKLPKLTTDEALKLLSQNGSLVKRPFVVGAGVGLVGFNEAAWTEALG
ncbi:Spx/MgsR family RNA polymerase-binding regulatory protein [Oleiharenicola lentus]|uniref:Spx/MgsR family RNA polymerase-binding regulatory protein n=1 Tax=Oleiharenicola lentus TaxID=2508720 RepID=UPI003F668A8C